MTTKARALLAACALLVLALVVNALRPRETPPEPRGERPSERTPGPGGSRAETPRTQEAPPPSAATLDPTLDAKLTQRSERVSQAIALLRYPPSSHPLRSDMADVIAPNRRHESPMPLSMAQGSKDPPKEGSLSFLLTGDAFTVVGADALTATLEVFRERGGQKERVAVDITAAEVSLVETAGLRAVGAVPLPNDEGRDGDARPDDKVYSLALAPAHIPALAAHRGLARLDLTFVAQEGDRKPARAALDFRLGGRVPAAITGVESERLTPDGLEITVNLHVEEAGPYVVQGLLFDAQDAPIGFAVGRPTLKPGRASVPLLFWGLLFREANATGPYVFRTVTGHRLPVGDEPDRADLATWAGPYLTRPYAPTDFSDKEYESAAKDVKIKALSDLATHDPAKAAGAPAK